MGAYEDSTMRVIWMAMPHTINFMLTNKADASLKVLWDEVTYIDALGSTSRIMHKGVRYMDRSASMPPSIVPSGSRLDDTIHPTDYVYYDDGQYTSGWEEAPLITPTGGYDLAALQEAKDNLGQTYSVLFPIEVGDERREYRFTFEVTGVEVPEQTTVAEG